jgi:hypothetical protein
MPRDIINGAAFPREQVVSEVPGDTLFVPVYTDDTGQAIGIPAAGDCLFGSPTTKFALLPRADRMLDAGALEAQFEDGFFKGELTGNRNAIPFGRALNFAGTTFLNTVDQVASSASTGYGVLRAGGIVGLSVRFYVQARAMDGLVAVRAFKNGSPAVSVLSGIITAGDVGTYLTVCGSIARSSLTALQRFVAGDFLSFDVQFITFLGTLKEAIAYVEIVTDT